MKKYLIIPIISLLIILIGISYAFYTVQIKGTGKNLVIKTSDLKIIFNDPVELSASGIVPGEWSDQKTFTVKSQTDETYYYNIEIENYLNTFEVEGYLQYKIENTSANGYNSDGWVSLTKSPASRTLILGYMIELTPGDTHEYKISFRYLDAGEVNQSPDMGKTVSGNLSITKGSTPLWAVNPNTLKSHILKDNYVNAEDETPERTSFSNAYTSSTDTFFKTNNAEFGETVYYYAGDAKNNWVIFGKYNEDSTYWVGYNSSDNIVYTNAKSSCESASGSECKLLYKTGDDIYWRIIRTNEESTGGGIRLLYSGTTPNTTLAITHISKHSNSYYEPALVGYMYGQTGINDYLDKSNISNSILKDNVDSWYQKVFNQENSVDEYGNQLSSYIDTKAIYCNDRTISDDYNYKEDVSVKYIPFASRLRAIANNPSYACGVTIEGFGHFYINSTEEDRKADRFSTDSIYGNGKLTTAPAALMNLDETIFAGASYAGFNQSSNLKRVWHLVNDNNETILKGRAMYLMTPSALDKGAPDYYMTPSTSTFFSTTRLGGSLATRPVLSLKSNVQWLSGNGTANNPYRIKIENE